MHTNRYPSASQALELTKVYARDFVYEQINLAIRGCNLSVTFDRNLFNIIKNLGEELENRGYKVSELITTVVVSWRETK